MESVNRELDKSIQRHLDSSKLDSRIPLLKEIFFFPWGLENVTVERFYFAGLGVTTGDDFSILLMLIFSQTLILNPNPISNSNSNPRRVFNLKFQFRFLTKGQSEASEIIFPVVVFWLALVIAEDRNCNYNCEVISNLKEVL